jgi:signal peptidase
MLASGDVGIAGPGTLRRSLRPALRAMVITILVVAAALAVAPSLLSFGGYRSMVVRSGSMEPALMTGDVIVSHIVLPSSLQVGDVVTFVDSTRGDILVTHRVVQIDREGSTYSFVTRGDMNTGVERWNIGGAGTVGRLAFRVPRLGSAVAWSAQPQVRALLLMASLLPLATRVLRRIWSR